jgi:hypothetical protein
MYRNLYDHNFFVAGASGLAPSAAQKPITLSTQQ